MINLNRVECKELPSIDFNTKYDAAQIIKESDGLYLQVSKEGNKYSRKIQHIDEGMTMARILI